MARLIVGFCLLASSFLLQGRELIIGVNQRDIYRIQEQNDVWTGKDIELVKAIFRRTPYSYKIVSMPWPRVLKSIEQGTVDLTLAAALTPERQVYARFSKQKFRYSHYMLFVLKNKLHRFKTVNSLPDILHKDILVGALRGAVYSTSFHDLLNNKAFVKQLAYIDNDQNMPEFALKGRVDAYIDSEIEGIHYLSKRSDYSRKIIPYIRITSEDEAGSYLMFSKKSTSEALVNEIDEALAELHRSGEYNQISQQFNRSPPNSN